MSTAVFHSSAASVDEAISMIGEAHMLCIIHHLSHKGMRFNELQRAVSGLNPTTLTDRLKKLEREGFVLRKEETVDRVSVLYELTEKGKAVLPIIRAIGKFADSYPTANS